MRGSEKNSWEEEIHWPKRKMRLGEAKENRRDLRRAAEGRAGGFRITRETGVKRYRLKV